MKELGMVDCGEDICLSQLAAGVAVNQLDLFVPVERLP